MYLDLGLEYRKCGNGGHNSTYSMAQINSVLKKSLQPSFLSISIIQSIQLLGWTLPHGQSSLRFAQIPQWGK